MKKSVTKKITIPECDVLQLVQNTLEAHGIYHWRNNTGAVKTDNRFIRYGKKGSSDILGICKDGRLLAIEVKKSTGGVVTDDQRSFIQAINDNGGVAFVCCSYAELIHRLKENGVI